MKDELLRHFTFLCPAMIVITSLLQSAEVEHVGFFEELPPIVRFVLLVVFYFLSIPTSIFWFEMQRKRRNKKIVPCDWLAETIDSTNWEEL